MSLFGTHTVKQVAVFSLAGLMIGLLSYCTLLVSPVVLLLPLLMCFLYIKGGYIPVLCAIAGYAASFTLFFGPGVSILLGLPLVVPGLLTILAVAKGMPCFKQFKISIAAFVGSLILLLAGAGALAGGDLVDLVINTLHAAMTELPADVQSTLLVAFYEELMDVNAQAIPVLEATVRTQYWKDFFIQLHDSLAVQLLPSLLQSCLTTAFLCSYLTARSLYLQGEIPESAFVPLSQWRVSSQMTVGILLTTFVSYLLSAFGLNNGVSVFLTMFTIMQCVFAVQGAAAWARMLCAAKASYTRKVITVGGMAVLAGTFLSAIGICSALFGRQGLLMKLKNRNQQK